MFWVLGLADLQKSENSHTKVCAVSKKNGESFKKLRYDSKRARTTSGHYTNNRKGYTAHYNHQNFHELTKANIEARSKTAKFENFLEQQIPTLRHRANLRRQYTQDIIQNGRTILSEATSSWCRTLTARDKVLVDQGKLSEDQQGQCFDPYCQIELDIYEKGTELYIDVTYSDIAICRAVSKPKPSGADGVWLPYQKIPGEMLIRWKIEKDQAAIEKCVVNNTLLLRLLMEKEVKEITPKMLKTARAETEAVKNLENGLSNTIYALKVFCEEIKLENPDDYDSGIALHDYLVEKHKAIFESARLDSGECRRIVGEVKDRLRSDNKKFSQYPGWKNVVVAMTGFGGVAMIAKGIYTKARYNHWNPYLFETRRVLDRSQAIEGMVNSIQCA